MSELNRGVLYGASAYLMWGLSTLYWPLLASSGALEILTHRMVWSLVAVVAVLAVRRHWRWLLGVLRSPRTLLLLTAAALVISVNWGLFILAVNSGQTSQAALGYFINPLVSVVMGVLVFAERLRPAQWCAVALGAVAVAVLTFAYGGVPWFSLGMAFSFATYGLVKRFVSLDGLESLAVETLLMFLPAAGYVAYLEATGAGTFASVSPGHTLLLIGSGVVTAVPLLCFGMANRRIPLSMIGLLQFVVPVMQFLFAWLVFHEELPASRWAGFAVVWVALLIFAADMLRNARRPGEGAEAPEDAEPGDAEGAAGRPAARSPEEGDAEGHGAGGRPRALDTGSQPG
ncbi:EamA family transporter RarD [Nocardiopsis potens]|uniref:EamA family transporter RarD n=1 Tax=Nocardiopsis potens TaxID=1246458 RepID=UPI000349767A|nr:EamA family transporter RarD [Nocardiopsis potens]